MFTGKPYWGKLDVRFDEGPKVTEYGEDCGTGTGESRQPHPRTCAQGTTVLLYSADKKRDSQA